MGHLLSTFMTLFMHSSQKMWPQPMVCGRLLITSSKQTGHVICIPPGDVFEDLDAETSGSSSIGSVRLRLAIRAKLHGGGRTGGLETSIFVGVHKSIIPSGKDR